ncbi:hypothetical protein GUITHDRAFT_74219, partial [Guillardia theta CCMP2712]
QFLASNKDAGTLIGRGGNTISSLQQRTGARIRVSNGNEYYPGTQNRIVLLTGQLSNIMGALEGSLREIYGDFSGHSAPSPPGDDRDSNGIMLTLAVPEISCGLLIGRGGENIRVMVEESGCKIQLTNKDHLVPGITERLVLVVGQIDRVLKAVELILYKMWEDPKCRYDNPTTQYNSKPLASDLTKAVRNLQGSSMQPERSSYTVHVPDNLVPAILGRGGQIIKEMMEVSGATIKVSQKGDFVPGTNNRIISIIGELTPCLCTNGARC